MANSHKFLSIYESHFINYMSQGGRFYIGNYKKCYQPFFQAVIDHGNFTYMNIDPEPVPIENIIVDRVSTASYIQARPQLIGYYFSMYSVGQLDLSDFWAFVNSMKHSPEWSEWYQLIADPLE